MPLTQHAVARTALRYGRITVAAGTAGTITRVTGVLTQRYDVRFRGPGYDIRIPGLTLRQIGLVRSPAPGPAHARRRPARR